MNQLLIFLLLILILFIVSRGIVNKIHLFWFLISRSNFISMWLVSLILFPGTVIHELSHWLAAEILRIPTGEIDLLPKRDEKGIRLGSVEFKKSGFIKSTIVGIAPFFTGLFFLYGLSSNINFNGNNLSKIISVLLIFLIFSVSNTMFSSKKDLEVAFPFFSILGIAIFFLWKIDFNVSENFINKLLNIMEKINGGIIIAVLVDLFILIGMNLIIIFFKKILKRNVVVK